MNRGDIYFSYLRKPVGSEPGYERPVIIIQSNTLNKTELNTVIVAEITSNTINSDLESNVFLPKNISKLKKDSCVKLTGIFTVDKIFLRERIGSVNESIMKTIDAGLNFVLALNK